MKILLFFTIFDFFLCFCISETFSPYELRPRLLVNDGHIYLHVGSNKNITFIAEGKGSIYFGSLDLKSLSALGHIHLFQQQISSVQSNCESVRGTVTLLASTQKNLQQTTGAMNSLVSTTIQVKRLLESHEGRTSGPQGQVNRVIWQMKATNTKTVLVTTLLARIETRGLELRLRRVESQLDQLKVLVNTNGCATNPCQNGGTCIDLVGKYLCLCEDQFTGPNCDVDVDECLMYHGTASGCQNGGTCVNIRGSFTCTCPPDYFGFRCTEKTDECQTGSHALCGLAGVCIANQIKIAGQANYRCVCDPGYKLSSSLLNPQCIDVDECISNPCFPDTSCINTPGSFHCSRCPAGFTGNGMQCWDIDECAINNGGCSIVPKVQCINTYGSFHCGPCPPGYQETGQSCSRLNSCARSPCHSQATCIEMPATPNGFRCQCPPSMIGDGIGAGGCQVSLVNPCLSNPCLNGGTCQSAVAGRFTCRCTDNYSGNLCHLPSSCSSNPCQGGGTCQSTSDMNRPSYMCLCTTDRYGINCEYEEAGCNANYMRDSSNFTYPNDSVYRSLANCEWTITGAANKVLNITFPKFDLKNSSRPGCPFDNLTIYDGPTTAYTVIGVYCSCKGCPKGPEPFIITSTNQVFVKFKTDLTIQMKGFTIQWTSISQVCGGRSSLNSGQVLSPDYPRMYSGQFHCLWLFSNQPTYHYKIEIGSIQFKVDDANCTKDKLQVRDGQRLDSVILAEYCTSSPGATFYSSLPYFSMYFQSSDFTPTPSQSQFNGGFMVKYSAIPMDRLCGGTLTVEEGVIQSPNFGRGSYFNDLNCIWIIDGANLGVSTVELTFLEFDVRGTFLDFLPRTRSSIRRRIDKLYRLLGRTGLMHKWTRCSGDYVEVRDGNSDMAAKIGLYCGKNLPYPIASKSNKMYIRFYADSAENAKGFTANYKIKCGGVLQGRNGTFQSPNFPLRYPTATQCEYIVKAPETYAILIKFTTVDLGNNLPFNCPKNYIEMQSKPENAWHNRKFCYVPVGRVFSSSGGNFKVIFRTNGSESNRGFQANFETLDVGCGGTFNARYGTIQSPRNVDEYLHNMHCRWYIEVPMGYVVQLNFRTFVLEGHRTCSFDYVSVYESYTNENQSSGFLGKYCGEFRPPSLVSSGNTMVVVFGTDSNIARSGFEATFEAVNASIGCDRSFVDTQGFVTNIGFPQPLTRSMECEYTIRVARGYRILLNVDNLTLSCSEGYIEIRNGPSANSPSVDGLRQSRLCGDSVVDSLRSQGNTLYLKFKTARVTINTQIIYSISYEQITEGCGGTLSAINGALSSPQYPYSSYQSYDCTWKISVSEGNTVSLIIGSFDNPLPRREKCLPWANRLEVRDGPFLTSRLIGLICYRKTTAFQSTSNYMTVRYVSHSIVAATGFFGHYSTVCNSRLNQWFGRLESPGYPNNAHSERNCVYRIETTVGNLLLLHFTHFKIEDSARLMKAQCRTAYLQFSPDQVAAVSNAALINSTNVTKFCNELFVPSIVYSKSNFIEIRFKSPVSLPANHFALEWTTIGCGGVFTENNGVFSVSNNSGDPMTLHHVCQWTIKAPIGQKVALTVKYLGFPFEAPFRAAEICQYEKDPSSNNYSGFFIFNGLNNVSGHACYSLCGPVLTEKELAPFVSTSNEMFIIMHYLPQKCKPREDSILMASYKFIDGGCGAVLNASKGYITSPSYPNVYPTSMECVWVIKIQPGYKIEFSITAFDLDRYMRNCQDSPPILEGYLAVYDGENDISPLIRRFCGNMLPDNPTITSSSNSMFIRFQGSSTEAAPGSGPSGFAANYSVACGTTLIADATLRSLESLKTTSFSECNWIITASNPGERVTLTINFLAIRSLRDVDGRCKSHYLEIYDGSEALNETKLDQICSAVAPPPYISSGNSLFLRLKTPALLFDSKRHFMITYTASASFCGGDYFAIRGAFNSPGYPQRYPPSSSCIWTINNNHGSRVRLQFSSFNLETSDFCSEDFLEVRKENESGKLLGRFCGTTIPPVVIGFKKLWIKFFSDEGSPGGGFQASYRLIFGGDVSGTSGIIASPWYEQRQKFNWAPAAVFGTFSKTDINQTLSEQSGAGVIHTMSHTNFPAEEALWRITVPEESFIQITFDEFSIPYSMDNNGQCWEIFQLKIYDGFCGYVARSEYLRDISGCTPSRSLCGLELPQPWISLTNTATLRLTAALNYQSPTFLIRWVAVPFYRVNQTIPIKSNVTCGGTLAATSEIAVLSSPGYPNGYDNNIDCKWLITHPKDYSVLINLTNVDLEPHIECPYDYLTIQQIGWQFAGINQRYTFESGLSPLSQGQDITVCSEPSLPPVIFSRQFPVEVHFVTDDWLNGSGFSIQYKLVCGGQFSLLGVTHKITSPNYPSMYSPLTRCIWVAKAPVGRTIEITFQSFHLENSTNCLKDYLQVLWYSHVINGNEAYDAVLGRYCGSTTPPTLQSTSHFIRVEFVSDEAINAQGFSIMISERRFNCSDDSIILTESSPDGYLTSPDYPNPYRHSLDCIWILQAPPGSRIQFDFDANHFDVEAGKNNSCIYGIEIRDGASVIAPLIGRYCGKTVPGTLFSRGSFLFVRMITDDSMAEKGFRARYSIAKCGGTILINSNGYITSPNYPHPYSSNAKCEWQIVAPEGHYISFSFTNIFLMSSSNCSSAYVEIRDVNITGDSFGRFCISIYADTLGENYEDTRMPRRSRTESIYVKFEPAPYKNTPGFKLAFKVSEEVCGGRFADGSGMFTSPMYPVPYPNKRWCLWVITVASNTAIQLVFDDLHLPENRMGDCKYDGVRVFNGPDINSPLINTFCGVRVPGDPIVSTSDAMTVWFYSDASVSGRGFKANYITLPGQGCGGEIVTETSILKFAPKNRTLYCHWKFLQPSPINSSINVRLNNVNLENSYGCMSDRIKVYGEMSTLDVNEPFVYCGNKNNVSLSFYHSVVHIQVFFYGVSNISQLVDIRISYSNCGGILTERQGVITSPGFPLLYDNNLQCLWLIIGAEGKFINATLTFSDIEHQAQCGYDRLIIRNGPSYNSPIARTFCNSTANLPWSSNNIFVSTSQKLLIAFQTDHSLMMGGFRLEYKQVSEGCGYVDQGDKGTIVSPNFPKNYPNNQFCEWEIVVVPGFHVKIKFNNFDVQQSDNCTKDFLKFEQLKTSAGRAYVEWYPLGDILCGYHVPENALLSETEHVKLTFKSDASTTGVGFSIDWTSACGSTYTNQVGYITSPYYPRNYESNMNCVYTIRPPEPGILYTVLEFGSFELEAFGGGNCVDSLEVIEMFTNTTLAKLCGSSLPDSISSKGPMQLIFKTNEIKNYVGFAAKYQVSECGGEIDFKDELQFRSATIKSPTFSAKYLNDIDCVWKVKGPPNKILNFKFLNMSMKQHVKCVYNYVELRDGDNENATLISKFCDRTAPRRYFKSSGNTMFIRFFSDASITRNRGFFGVVSATLGPNSNCGGVINVTRAPLKITSPGSLGALGPAYGQQLSCEWFILAPQDKIITVNITRFTLENPGKAGKCFDYLEVFDGLFENIVGKYCGSLQPWQFSSSGNQLHLHFATDASIEMGGFELWLTAENAICGRTIQANDSVIYVTESYTIPNPYFRCRWKIVAPPNRKISIQLMQLDFPSTPPQCSRGYLQFSDVPISPNRPPVRECGTRSGFTFVSMGNFVLIMAVYGSSLTQRYSFNFSVQALQDCNRTITLDALNYGGRLTSPNFPDRYVNNASCTTQLNAPDGYKITLYFISFRLEEKDVSNHRTICLYDSLSIIEDGKEPVIHCGKAIPPTYTSTSNKIKLFFKTHSIIVSFGYDLSYTISDSGCGGTLVAERGAITSPYYPNPYPENIQCSWLIRVPEGARLKFVITALSMSSSSSPPALANSWNYYDDEETEIVTLPRPEQFFGDSTTCNDQMDRVVIRKNINDPETPLYTICSLDVRRLQNLRKSLQC